MTLSCEDDKQVKAHKFILAASSPFFKDILKRNKDPHPLIYTRGLKLEDLLAIINILYFGEANAFQENLDTFLVLAEEQRPKGLTGSGNSGKGKEPPKNKENFETAPIKRENAKQNPVPSISDPNKQKHCHCHRETFN